MTRYRWQRIPVWSALAGRLLSWRMGEPRRVNALESTAMPQSAAKLHDGKTEAIARFLRRSISKQPRRILVVGCGSGLEAAILAQEFGAQTIGIDMNADFNPTHAALATLK